MDKLQKYILISCFVIIAALVTLFFTVQKWYIFLFGIPLLVAAVFNVTFLIIKSKFQVHELKKHHDLAGFIITTMGAIYGVIVGFTIVNAQDHVRILRSGIDKEAYVAADLFKMAENLPNAKQKIFIRLYNYLKSVAKSEWYLMPEQKEDPKTLSKLKDLWYAYYEYTPSNAKEEIWLAENLTLLQELNKARLVRIYESWQYLDALSWLALLVGGVIMICFLFVFGTENLTFQIGINTAYTYFIAFLFILTYYFNHPFEPPLKISPHSYEVVYEYYQSHGIFEDANFRIDKAGDAYFEEKQEKVSAEAHSTTGARDVVQSQQADEDTPVSDKNEFEDEESSSDNG